MSWFHLPTFSFSGTAQHYALSQVIAYFATFIYGSFFEWTLHRNVMHKKTWISYPFELHAMLHHKIFRHDETYHAQNEEMLTHVTFVPRDYVLLLLVNTPLFMAIELLVQQPILIGTWTAVLTYLAFFDILHWSFHVPKEHRMEKIGVVRWLKEHHRLHHRHQNRNLNVVFPLADFVFRTRISKAREEEQPAPPEPVSAQKS